MTLKVVIGADHGGFELKQKIIKLLESEGHKITDAGCNSEESVDYPDIAEAVIEKLSSNVSEKAILVCGTGIGMSIAANRHPFIRAALCHDQFTAEMSRAHNDANVLCLGGRVLEHDKALEIVKKWVETVFEGGRHLRRIEKFSH